MKRRSFLTSIPFVAALSKALGREQPPEVKESEVRVAFNKRERSYSILFEGGPKNGEMEAWRSLPRTIDAFAIDHPARNIGKFSAFSTVAYPEISATCVGQYHLVPEAVPTGLYTYRFRPLAKGKAKRVGGLD